MKLVLDGNLRIDILEELSKKPALFEKGDKQIWTDEHISKKMLEAHLDPEDDMASRKHDRIIRSCEWLVSHLDLIGSKVIDLGCGPGLYCMELAQHGVDVTGVDFSKRSIEFARSQNDDSIKYIHGDYLSLDFDEKFDAALLIYYDFDVLADDERDILLDKVHSLLKDGGHFVFDVITPYHKEAGQEITRWSVDAESGFWKDGGYMELMQRFYYPDEQVKVDQYLIVDKHGDLDMYRIWHRFYTLTHISNLLKKHGFVIEDFYEDLMGTPYVKKSSSIGVIARKNTR